MNLIALLPLETGGAGQFRWAGGPPPFFPLIGVVMCLVFLLLVVAAIMFFRRSGGPGRPPWARWQGAPEEDAKRVLAERFAHGEISTDEFLERASVLNWTPGSEPPAGKRRG